MTRRRVVLAAAGIVVALIAAFEARDPASPRRTTGAAPAASPTPARLQVADQPLSVPAAAAASSDAAPSPARVDRTPEQIVAAARLHGDERAPPIDTAEPEPAPATPWEVASPELYQAREQRMTEEMHTRFVQASEQRLVTLRAAVERMRAEGVSPDLLAMAEDKVRHLQAVHDAVVRGEPLGTSH